MGADRQNPSGTWHSASGTKVPLVPLWKKGCGRAVKQETATPTLTSTQVAFWWCLYSKEKKEIPLGL
jgi:hypothetical protein